MLDRKLVFNRQIQVCASAVQTYYFVFLVDERRTTDGT